MIIADELYRFISNEKEKNITFELFKKHMVECGFMLETDDIYEFVFKFVSVDDDGVHVYIPDYELERVKNATSN